MESCPDPGWWRSTIQIRMQEKVRELASFSQLWGLVVVTFFSGWPGLPFILEMRFAGGVNTSPCLDLICDQWSTGFRRTSRKAVFGSITGLVTDNCGISPVLSHGMRVFPSDI